MSLYLFDLFASLGLIHSDEALKVPSGDVLAVWGDANYFDLAVLVALLVSLRGLLNINFSVFMKRFFILLFEVIEVLAGVNDLFQVLAIGVSLNSCFELLVV